MPSNSLKLSSLAVGVLGGSPHIPWFGVNMLGAQLPTYKFPNTADWDYIASKKMKYVRMQFAWENIQTTLLGSLNATYLAAIQSALAAAAARGIGVILNMSNDAAYCITGWGTTYTNPGNGGFAAAGVGILGDGTLTSAHFVDVWTKIATALVGSAGLLGYDLCNEPWPVIGTNRMPEPNYFGGPAWFTSTAGIVTKEADGTNPLGANYGPAWTLSNPAGYDQVGQSVTLSAVPYTFSFQAQSVGGSNLNIYAYNQGGTTAFFTATSAWQRFQLHFTPTAGSNTLWIAHNSGTPQTVRIANSQLELGGSATTYAPSPWLPFAQAAITAIRAVDAVTPIHVEGMEYSIAATWLQSNYELCQLTGGNLIFQAHQYFDGTEAAGGGGGQYAHDYSYYSPPLTANSGVNEATAFVNYCAAKGLTGMMGESGIPNLSTDNNAAWFPLMRNFWSYIKSSGMRGCMWTYYNQSGGAGDVLKINPVAGVDDPRLVDMLKY